jgi:hypothetical protein
VYICDGGPLGSLTLPEAFTDRGVLPAARPVTADGLADLARVMAALRNGLTESEERG